MNAKEINTKLAKELNEVMGTRNNVEIWCNAYANFVISGKPQNVAKSVQELCMFGLTLLSLTKADNTNPFCDGKDLAIVGKVA